MSFNVGFIVVNGSATETMTKVSVVSDQNSAPITAEVLHPGEAAGPVYISENGSQNWILSYHVGGQCYYRDSKECGFDDSDDGQIAMIILYPGNFSVIPPQSSNCPNNYVDNC